MYDLDSGFSARTSLAVVPSSSELTIIGTLRAGAVNTTVV